MLLLPLLVGCERRPRIDSADPDVRRLAVEAVSTEGELASIARSGGYGDVRVQAVQRIGDQAILADIAKNGPSDDARFAAIKKLTNNTVLCQIFQEDPANVAVLLRINDQEFLGRVATDNPDQFMRERAVRAVTNRVVLLKMVCQAKVRAGFRESREHALGRLPSHTAFTDAEVQAYGRESLREDLDLLARARDACRNIPDEHKNRLSLHVLDLLRQLREEPTTTESGMPQVSIGWESRTQAYYGSTSGGHMPGEKVTISVEAGQRGTFSQIWESDFPTSVEVHRRFSGQLSFLPAAIRTSDLVKAILRKPPASASLSDTDLQTVRRRLEEARRREIGEDAGQP